MKYEREVDHCKPSPYVREVTIYTVKHAQNSDNLDAVTFEEFGWNAITGRGTYKPGDKVTFIPPESVLPVELAEEFGITKFLSKGRVRILRLRNNRSEGVVLKAGILAGREHLILKWEDLPSRAMNAEFTLPSQEISPRFERFYSIPQLFNEPYTFQPGEAVAYSEKIHGVNFRFGVCAHPETNKRTFYVGSHYIVMDHVKCGDKNLFSRIANEIFDSGKAYFMGTDTVFYAEIYGRGVQHLHYGLKNQTFRVYAITLRGEYVSYDEVLRICEDTGLPVVQFHETTFENIEQFRTLADESSEYADQIREGIVIVSRNRPRIMAKVIGFNYLTKKSKSRTERH